MVRRTSAETTFCYAVSIGFCLFLAVPVLWLLSSSFKDQLAIFKSPPVLVATPTLANYRAVLGDEKFLHSLMNSLIVASGTVVVTMLLAMPAAYGLSRLRAARARLSIVAAVRARGARHDLRHSLLRRLQ